MAAVLGLIPRQGFETVRDAIGIVLLEELSNQKILQNFNEEINLYNDRLTPMDDTERLYINILLDSANYTEKNQIDQLGRTTYFIDVYTNGIATMANGESDATDLLYRYIGLIRYILSATAYKTLGLPLGLIAGTQVESFGVLDPAAKEDSVYTRFARLQFSVRILEGQEAWAGISLLGNNSNVKLDLTNKGYKYIID